MTLFTPDIADFRFDMMDFHTDIAGIDAYMVALTGYMALPKNDMSDLRAYIAVSHADMNDFHADIGLARSRVTIKNSAKVNYNVKLALNGRSVPPAVAGGYSMLKPARYRRRY